MTNSDQGLDKVKKISDQYNDGADIYLHDAIPPLVDFLISKIDNVAELLKDKSLLTKSERKILDQIKADVQNFNDVESIPVN